MSARNRRSFPPGHFLLWAPYGACRGGWMLSSYEQGAQSAAGTTSGHAGALSCSGERQPRSILQPRPRAFFGASRHLHQVYALAAFWMLASRTRVHQRHGQSESMIACSVPA